MNNDLKTVGANPMTLIEMALKNDVGLDKLEKLMDLKERWDAGEAAKSFKRAMAEFQAKKPILKKTAKAHNSFYCPLSKMQQAIDPVLSECGLSYRWIQEQTTETVKVTCVVSHIDGHTEETTLEAPHDNSGNKNPIHSIGSTVSYLNRYTLSSAFGLSSDKDDDGGKPQAPKVVKIDPKEISKAEKSLNSCTSLIELQTAYVGLSKQIQSVKTIIELKDSLKKTLK